MKVRTQEALLAFIADYRKQSRIDATILASSANVSAKFISQLENGKITIEVDALVKVAKALGLDIPLLFNQGLLGSLVRKNRDA